MSVRDTENSVGPKTAGIDRWAVHRRPSLEAVTMLLAQADLPTDDVDGKLEHFFGAGREGRVDGVVGLELLSGVALLRSLAVDSEKRGRGMGRGLVKAAERYAREKGVQRIYLLTETAEGFFSSLGYKTIERSAAPEGIRGTREFSELCPASASFMAKEPVISLFGFGVVVSY